VGLFVKVYNVDDIFEWIIVFDKLYGVKNLRVFEGISVCGGK
jgi:hypothetical protein